MSENDNFRYGNKEFFGRDGCTSMGETVEDTMYVMEVLPDESADAGIVQQGLVVTSIGLKACRRSLDAAVVHEGPGDMRDFQF